MSDKAFSLSVVFCSVAKQRPNTMTSVEQQLEKSKRQAFSVNIPDEKKEAWAKIAKAHNRPMTWLFLEMVDRMIEANSIHIYQDSDQVVDIVTRDDVRSMIDDALTPISDELESIKSRLAKSPKK
jgi:hypothetical protein